MNPTQFLTTLGLRNMD